jgi:hypothetical protein
MADTRSGKLVTLKRSIEVPSVFDHGSKYGPFTTWWPAGSTVDLGGMRSACSRLRLQYEYARRQRGQLR